MTHQDSTNKIESVTPKIMLYNTNLIFKNIYNYAFVKNYYKIDSGSSQTFRSTK